MKKERKEKKLTIKQKKFIKGYIETGNGTQSAIKAGYSKNCAQEIASENLSKPIIKETIAQIAERLGINPESVLKNYKHLTDYNLEKISVPMGAGENTIINEVMRNPVVAHKSNDSLARVISVITDKVEVTGKDGESLIPISTDKEKLELAKQIALALKNSF